MRPSMWVLLPPDEISIDTSVDHVREHATVGFLD
jgi:hypothetical protein